MNGDIGVDAAGYNVKELGYVAEGSLSLGRESVSTADLLAV